MHYVVPASTEMERVVVAASTEDVWGAVSSAGQEGAAARQNQANSLTVANAPGDENELHMSLQAQEDGERKKRGRWDRSEKD
jgi:hypothetical protein